MTAAPVWPLLHVSADLGWSRFSVHPSTVVGLAALAALYFWSAARSRGLRPAPWQPRVFVAALLLMFLSLNGWVHDLSDSYLFSAHMVQHLVLAMAVAPLLVMAAPGWMLRPLVRRPRVLRLAALVTGPRAAFAIFNVVLAAWHLPPLYNLAMTYHEVHIVQHLMFLAASVIMWWPVLSPMPELPRIAYPAQIAYLFLMTIPMSIVAVYIVYADAVLYPAYATAPRVWGISPMQDQQIGGLIMWIPGGLYFFTIISVVFYRWQQRGAADDALSAQVPTPVST